MPGRGIYRAPARRNVASYLGKNNLALNLNSPLSQFTNNTLVLFKQWSLFVASDQNKAKSVSSPSIGYSGGSVRARLTTLSSPFIMAEGKITIPPPIGLLVSPCGARGRRSAGATRRNVGEFRARSASCPRSWLLLRPYRAFLRPGWEISIDPLVFSRVRGAGREPGARWHGLRPRPGAAL